MATIKRSKPLRKTDIENAAVKQSSQIQKQLEARQANQDEEMKYLINTLINASKLKPIKVKKAVNPTVLKMVEEMEKKTSTINSFLKKTTDIGVAANSKEIDSITQKAHTKPVALKNKKINSEQMYTESMNLFKTDQLREYRFSPRLKSSPRQKSPRRRNYPTALSPKAQSPTRKWKNSLKRRQLPEPKPQALHGSTHTLTLGHEQQIIPNVNQTRTSKLKQHFQQSPSSQNQVMPSTKQKLMPKSKQRNPNPIPQQNRKSKRQQSPKRKTMTNAKKSVSPSRRQQVL